MKAGRALLVLCVAPLALGARVAPLAFSTPPAPLGAGPGAGAAGARLLARFPARALCARTCAGAGLSALRARDGDDELGDITRLLSDEPVVAAGKSRMLPTASPLGAETDIIMRTGVGQSEHLQDAIDEAVGAAAANWPRNAEGQPKVPSLAVMFFSSHYAQQGLGRVLPCLLRTFATTGGKPWKVGVSVVGCTAEGFDLEDDSTPAVSVTLIHGSMLTVLPFCAGDEAAAWTETDWGYKAGLKGLYDDPRTSLLLLGHPSSLSATSAALQQLHSAYPTSNKLGGIAGGAPGSDAQDRCVIFRKGTGVFNKRGQLIFGEDKAAAKYSTSDDLFFDGGAWRRSGLVGAAISGLTLDNVCLGAGGEDVKAGLARVAANKSIKKEDGLVSVGGIALVDKQSAQMLAPPSDEGVRKAFRKTLDAPVAVSILEQVLVTSESATDLTASVNLAAADACSLITAYGQNTASDDLAEDEPEAMQAYQDTIVNLSGEILTIPKYEGPQQKRGGGVGKKKGKRR